MLYFLACAISLLLPTRKPKFLITTEVLLLLTMRTIMLQCSKTLLLNFSFLHLVNFATIVIRIKLKDSEMR